MKIEHSGSEVVSTSHHKAQKFGVNQGAQMFKVLSDTLYSDKVRAIIRETACNAWDAHKAAGNSDVPFEIHLPTVHEPYFVIKDFGTGLSHENLMELFCTYFGSNKTFSNDFIGALGLGSKSPFCYTPMFNVKCTFEGVTRMYEARVDEHGEPTVQQMGDDAVTPQLSNGIEIKFAVKQNDIYEFENKAKLALEFFEPRPTLNCNLDIPKQNYTVKSDRWGMRPTGIGVRAIMGNVAYQVGTIDISRLNSNTRRVAELPLDIFFQIGDLSFTASREALELDEKTVKALTDAYTEIYDSFIDAIKAKIEACENSWDARLLVFSLTSASGLGGMVNDAWNTGKLFGQYKNFMLEGTAPKLYALDYTYSLVMLFNHNRKASVNSKKEFVFHGYSKSSSDEIRKKIADGDIQARSYEHRISYFDKNNDVHFVVNDLEKKWERYVHYFIQKAVETESHGKKHVYVITRNDENVPMDKFLEEAKRMIASLGSPKFDLVSTYATKYTAYFDKQREKRAYNREASGRRSIVELNVDIARRRYEDGWRKAWGKSDQQVVGVKFYVPLEKLVATEAGFDDAFKFAKFVQNVRYAGVFGLDQNTPVYGLRKNAKLRKDPNWVELTSHVMNAVKKLMTPEKEAQLILLLCPFSANIYDNILTHLVKDGNALDADSPVQQFAEELAAARRGRSLMASRWDSFKEVLAEASSRGYYKQGPITDFNKKWERVIRQYPLISMVSSYDYRSRHDEIHWRKAVLEYIGFVDESRRKAVEAERHELAMTAIAAGEGSQEVIQ